MTMIENAGFHVTTAIKEGDPRTELVDAASESHADLIMVSSHSRTVLDWLLMGSVSEAMARYAQCPVLPPRRDFRIDRGGFAKHAFQDFTHCRIQLAMPFIGS